MNKNSMGRAQGYRYPGVGPLRTDHLQVRNLDRELEMLRHKRKVIQREQHMLSLECEMNRKRQYEHSNRNVSNMYGNVWQSAPAKRANSPQVNPWMGAVQDNIRPTMSKPMPSNYIPSLLSKKIELPYTPIAPKPNVGSVLKNTDNQRLGPVNFRKDYRLTQVTKKKLKAPPNKLNSYPIKDRKDLVSKATESLSATKKPNSPPEDPDAMVLREDQVPNKQVTGRLELALGSIVKEIRCSNSHNEKFKSLISNTVHQRTMKQAVRERLRTVMVNQTIGSVAEIINKYREKFPKRTDKDIVELVLNYGIHNFVTVIESECPEDFFKKNISSLIEKKVKEMSSNLQKMYCNDRRKTILSYTKVVDDVNIKPDEQSERDSKLNNEMAMKILRSMTGKYVSTEERSVLTRYYTELIENILEEKLPEYLSQCTDHFLKVFDWDRQFKAVKFMATKQIKDEIKAKKAEEATASKTQVETHKKELSDNDESEKELVIKSNDSDKVTATESNDLKKETTTENNDLEEDAATESNGMKEEAPTESNDLVEEAATKSNDLLEKAATESKELEKEAATESNDLKLKATAENNIIKEELATTNKEMEKTASKNNEKEEQRIIDKHTQEKPLENAPDKMETSKSDNTEEMSLTMPGAMDAEESSPPVKSTTPMLRKTEPSTSPEPTPIKPSSASAKEFPYYVKLVGRPKLPNRAAICDFLNNYQPSSIKKHKSINNLLVVGFANKEDYNKILTANETLIGDITIIIKAGEKVSLGKENESIKEENKVKEETEKEISDDASNTHNESEAKDLIGSELNDQITELLSTIQKAEEETNEEIDNEADDHENSVKRSLQPIIEAEITVKNEETHESAKNDKSSKASVKESGRATPVRSSSRLANVTPSTIRTRRASRLIQEQ